MKKLVAVVVLVIAVFVVYNRQRLYVHDVLANVTVDGVKEDGTSVYINFSNDVLLLGRPTVQGMLVVQHENHVGVPVAVPCMHWVACLLDADVVTLVQASGDVVEGMSGKTVTVREGKKEVVVTLR